MKGRWIFKMIVGGALMIAAFTAVVMWLWNMLIPDLFHGPMISYWQTLGLIVLSKIFFSGGHGWKGRGRWKQHHEWHERWEKMTPEERDQMKMQWKERCSRWRSMKPSASTDAPAS